MTKSTLLKVLDGKPCLKLTPEATAQDAVQIMKRAHCGAVCIIENGSLLGIFTERDLLTRVVAESLDPARVKLKTVMTPDPITAQVNDGLREAASRMCLNGIRHIPVLNNRKLVGILSIRHLYQEICEVFERKISEQDALISYMFGTEYGSMGTKVDKKLSA